MARVHTQEINGFLNKVSDAFGLPPTTRKVVIEVEVGSIVRVYAQCLPTRSQLDEVVRLVREVAVSESGEVTVIPQG